jgi:hypothetical protein
MVRLDGLGTFDELAADTPLRMVIEEQLDILAQTALVALQADHII